MNKYVLIVLALLSINVNAAVLYVPETIFVSNLDGVEQTSGFFAEGMQIELTVGEHSLIWQYQDFIEGDDDDHTKVKSALYVTHFSVKQGHSELFLRTGDLHELNAARAFSKNPNILIETEQNIAVKLLTQSFFDFNSAQKLKQLNAFTQSATSSIAQQDSTLALKPAEKPILSNDQAKPEGCNARSQYAAVEMLKCVWKHASKSDKDAFIYFILAEQQANK